MILKEESIVRNHWPLARVEKVSVSSDGRVRHVDVVVSTDKLDTKGRRSGSLRSLERPVTQLVLLQRCE